MLWYGELLEYSIAAAAEMTLQDGHRALNMTLSLLSAHGTKGRAERHDIHRCFSPDLSSLPQQMQYSGRRIRNSWLTINTFL